MVTCCAGLGTGRACVWEHVCKGGWGVGVESRGVFSIYIFRIVFSSALPRGSTQGGISI